MSLFFAGALLLSVVTLGALVWPLLRHGRRLASAEFSRKQLNAAIYRDQLAELERDRDEGALSQVDYEQAQTELQRRMLEDTADADAQATPARIGRALPIGLAISLPIAATALYLVIGNPQAINAPAHPQRFNMADIERMVSDMAAKLEKEPENFNGWAMLARSYKVMGRYPEAVRAYARTGPLLDSSADLLIDYADAQAAADGGFSPQVLALVDKALKLDPANAQGLWLRGSAAFEAKQFDQAIADWEVLLKALPEGSEDANAIAANLAEARKLKPAPSARPAAKK